jgi:very-short-patch-repair endonuclease
MTARPRQLRRNATDAENRLWYVLRNRSLGGWKFVRQFPVGPYIADFACREAALIVEIDGSQHADNANDFIRMKYLNAEGYGVLRFWNGDVLQNRDAVTWAIQSTIEGSPSPDHPFAPATHSPMGRGIGGVRAAASSHRQALARTIPLPFDEERAKGP